MFRSFYMLQRRALLWLIYVAATTLVVCATEQVPSHHRSPEDIAELSATLFPVHRAPLAREDTWTRLDDHDREAWTFANYQLKEGHPLERAYSRLSIDAPILVPVRIIVLLGDDRIKPVADVTRIERALHAGRNGNGIGNVVAQFRISFASTELVARVKGISERHEFQSALEREYSYGSKWHGSNVMLVLVNFPDVSVPVNKPQLVKDRLSWLWCRGTDRLLDVLATAERAVGRLYVPKPSYYPLSTPDMVRIAVHPYSPGHSHRASWFEQFKWHEFEAAVREIAPHGQTVGFFASQSNAECDYCPAAFGTIDSLNRDWLARSAKLIERHVVQNSSRMGAYASDRRSTSANQNIESTFHIYVLDTAHAVAYGEEVLHSLAKMPPAIFRGIAILALRSSRHGAAEQLRQQMVASVAAGVYGVADPGQYSDASPELLQDVIIRNIVSSVVAARADEATHFLQDLESYGIQPAKVLDDREYAQLIQRLNLLVFKLDFARTALSTANDATSAIHYALAASHDVRAIRATFGLGPGGEPRTIGGFRDLTVRCHFSRVKRGMLRAGNIFRKATSDHVYTLVALAVYAVFTVLSYVALRVLKPSYSRLKSH
jgi:hypothetical protein